MATQLIGVGGQTVELALREFQKRLISRNRAETYFMRFGRKDSIGRRMGKAISYRRFESIYSAGTAGSAAAGSAPSALTEGTQPAAINGTWSEVQASVSQYGQVLLYSDLSETQTIDDVMSEAVENLSEAMNDALDLLTRDVLSAGTNVQYAGIAATRGGASGVGSGMYLNLAELREAKRTLSNNNVKGVKSEDGLYVVITNPNAMFDLEADSNITNVFQYSHQAKHNEELFSSTGYKDLPLGFRVFETTNTRVFAAAGLSVATTAANVVATLVIGEDGYAVIDYDAFPPQIIRKERGSGGATGDPLDQIASVGWKASHAAVILDQARIVRIEHVTSASQ